MNKMSPQRARERALFLYRSALERGDFDTMMTVLKMAERDPALTQMIEEMAELDEAPLPRPERRIASLFRKSKGISEVVIRRDTSPDGWPHIPDQSEEETDMFTTFVPARSPHYAGARKLKWDPITLAVAVLVVVVLGMVLLFMRAAFNPGSSGAPEESVPEFAAQPGECDLSTDHLLAGNSALEGGDYEAALAEFTCEIQRDTKNYEARLGRIFAHLLSGQYALEPLDWAIVRHENMRVWYEAIDRYSAELEAKPDDLLLLVKRSYVNSAPGGLEAEAIADFDHILELDPDNIYALLYRGMAYQTLHQSDSAAADFERAIALAPDNPHVYMMIGVAIVQTDRSRARENIEHAIQLDPDVAWFYEPRCYEFYQPDDCTHAIELEPEEPMYYYWRGLYYQQYTVYREEAVADFTRAIQLDPEWADFYFQRALSSSYMGDTASIPADMLQVIEHMQTESIVQNVVIGETVTLPLTTGTVYRIPILARGDQMLSVRGGRPSTSSQPIYVILDADNTPLVSNLVGQSLLSLRNYEIPADGMYTLLVSLSLNPTEGDHTFVVELDG